MKKKWRVIIVSKIYNGGKAFDKFSRKFESELEPCNLFPEWNEIEAKKFDYGENFIRTTIVPRCICFQIKKIYNVTT